MANTTVEEVLTHDERLRLECIAQAVALNVMRPTGPDSVVVQARRFEMFIRGTGDYAPLDGNSK